MKRKEKPLRVKRGSLTHPKPPMPSPERSVKLKEGAVLKPGLAGTSMRYHKEMV